MIGFLREQWGIVSSDILAHYGEDAGRLGLVTLTARLAALPPESITKRLLAAVTESSPDPLDAYNVLHAQSVRDVSWKEL